MAQGAKKGGQRIRASMRGRSLALLAAVASLVVQLFLAPLHLALPAQSSAKLAELAALTGQHSVLCDEAADHQPGNPSHGDADCPGLCCQLGHGLHALLSPPLSRFGVALGGSIEIRPSGTIFLRSGTHSSSAQPRGPPVTV